MVLVEVQLAYFMFADFLGFECGTGAVVVVVVAVVCFGGGGTGSTHLWWGGMAVKPAVLVVLFVFSVGGFLEC